MTSRQQTLVESVTEVVAVVDTAPRPEFSRFENNLTEGNNLPIFPLTFPKGKKLGAMLLGDYIAQDMIRYATTIDPRFRDKWIIMSTTQSDAIPTDCSSTDFNFFTNQSGIEDYLASLAGVVPYSTALGDGHYVDPEFFFPDDSVEKRWDIVYPAKWYPTKRIELLIEAARLAPDLKFAIYGWPVPSERKVNASRVYRDQILELAKALPNVEVFDSGFDRNPISHENADGSIVIGSLTKEEMRDQFFRKARASIFLSETTEAINRVCTEMLCCDVPMLVAPTKGGLERLVEDRTGVMIQRTPSGIVRGVRDVLARIETFSPRDAFTERYGRENANRVLRDMIAQVAESKGRTVNWESYTLYGGDLWTTPGVYGKVLPVTEGSQNGMHEL